MKIRRKSMEDIYTNELRKVVEEIPNTSAYKRGIKKYTDELLDNLEEMARIYKRLPKDENELEEWLLKGARNWENYSYRGYSLKFSRQIAERLCNPSELKKRVMEGLYRKGERLGLTNKQKH